MNKASRGILSVIGGTRLIKLEALFPDESFNLFVKLEYLNPGGSSKDRSALNIIRRSIENGDLAAGGIVVESSSGNMAVGLAQVCKIYGLKFFCVVDTNISKVNLAIIQAYGGIIEMVTEPDSVSGDFLPARLARVQELLRAVPGSFWTNQYQSIHNAEAHRATMAEIATELDNKVDYLFCGTSSCGTIQGCSDYIREYKLNTSIIGIDAEGSRISGAGGVKRLLPGLGAAIFPKLLNYEYIDQFIRVTDWDCIFGCRLLIEREGIFAGGSSGGIVSALSKTKGSLKPNSNCVVIFPDRGERYVDTIYSNEWVMTHFGRLPSFA